MDLERKIDELEGRLDHFQRVVRENFEAVFDQLVPI
jgi:hypothetical protein